MLTQDIFVGIVAVLLGLFVFASAIFDSPWFNRFWLSRRIENAANQSVARLVIMSIGAICMLLGTLLLLGFFPSDSGEAEPSTELDVPGRVIPPGLNRC